MRLIDETAVIQGAGEFEICREYTFDVPPDKALFIYAQQWNFTPTGFTRLPLYFKKHDPEPGTVLVIPLPAADGYCGDGRVTAAEGCDTLGDLGCDPSGTSPKCLSGCLSCGCGSEDDCPWPTTIWAPCGYGVCADNEIPVFFRACIYGMCLFPYRCEYSPECVSRTCLPDRDTQVQCDAMCSDVCFYNGADDCWNCGGEGDVVPPPCSSLDDIDCLAHPSLFGTTFLEGTGTDVDQLRDQFALGGYTDEETVVLASSEGVFDAPRAGGPGIPTLAPGWAVALILLVSVIGVLVLQLRRGP
jgi:hypothetical protein